MAVDDLWFKDEDGKKVPSSRHGRGKRYRVRVYDAAGKLIGQPLFEKLKGPQGAETFDANARADISRGTYIDPKAGVETVEQYAERWRGIQMHEEGTAVRVEKALRLHVYPVLGRLQLRQVRRSNVQAWVKNRTPVLAPSTLRVIYSIVASIFSAAVFDGIIPATPCQKITLPDLVDEEYLIPTPEQVYGLADALPTHYRAMVFVAAGCGLRIGEIWGLEKSHIDFMRREVHVRQQLVRPRSERYLKDPKTRLSRRTVELAEVVGLEVARHMELFPPRLVTIMDRSDPNKPVEREAELIFTNTIGMPLQTSTWRKAWLPAVERVGLDQSFGMHGLRHYFATALIHGGASVKTVQLALGHSKPSITHDTYVHLWPDAVDRVRNLIDSALTCSPPVPKIVTA
jgi:integrase